MAQQKQGHLWERPNRPAMTHLEQNGDWLQTYHSLGASFVHSVVHCFVDAFIHSLVCCLLVHCVHEGLHSLSFLTLPASVLFCILSSGFGCTRSMYTRHSPMALQFFPGCDGGFVRAAWADTRCSITVEHFIPKGSGALAGAVVMSGVVLEVCGKCMVVHSTV